MKGNSSEDMRGNLLPFALILLVIYTVCAEAQTPPPPPPPTDTIVQTRQKMEEERRMTEILNRTTAPQAPPSAARVPRREPMYPGRRPSLISPALKKRLELTPEEKRLHRDFLRKRRTGAFRIYSAPSCASDFVINAADERCLGIEELINASYFSFRTNEYGFRSDQYGRNIWTDIRFIEDEFVAGNKFHTVGLFVDIGKVDIRKVNKQTPEVKMLRSLPRVKTSEQEYKQKNDLQSGIRHQDLLIKDRQKVRLNQTYLLRTVSYIVGSDGYMVHNTDDVYAMQVVKFDADNIVLVLWKKIFEGGAYKIK